jgi:hypothetical protein
MLLGLFGVSHTRLVFRDGEDVYEGIGADGAATWKDKLGFMRLAAGWQIGTLSVPLVGLLASGLAGEPSGALGLALMSLLAALGTAAAMGAHYLTDRTGRHVSVREGLRFSLRAA